MGISHSAAFLVACLALRTLLSWTSEARPLTPTEGLRLEEAPARRGTSRLQHLLSQCGWPCRLLARVSDLPLALVQQSELWDSGVRNSTDKQRKPPGQGDPRTMTLTPLEAPCRRNCTEQLLCLTEEGARVSEPRLEPGRHAAVSLRLSTQSTRGLWVWLTLSPFLSSRLLPSSPEREALLLAGTGRACEWLLKEVRLWLFKRQRTSLIIEVEIRAEPGTCEPTGVEKP